MGETAFWRDQMNYMLSSRHFSSLSKDTKYFFGVFHAELNERLIRKANAGDRGGVASPFQAALIATLKDKRNITPDKNVAFVRTPLGRKSADVSFSHRQRRWIIELKTGLNFNSLGAAVLEGIIFLQDDPSSRFLILGLYDQFPTVDDPVSAARKSKQMLRKLGIPKIERIDIFMLSRPPRHLSDDDEWVEVFAEGVEDFLGALPAAKQD